MSDEDFDEATPVAQGDRIEGGMDSLVNKLLIVRPKEFVTDMVTEFKPNGAEAVFATIACLDPIEGEPWKVFTKALVMQGYLIGAFKASINKTLIGTIVLGERKAGQKPPFKWQALNDKPKAVERGKAWRAQHGHLLDKEPDFDEAAASEKPSAETSRKASWDDEEAPF